MGLSKVSLVINDCIKHIDFQEMLVKDRVSALAYYLTPLQCPHINMHVTYLYLHFQDIAMHLYWLNLTCYHLHSC